MLREKKQIQRRNICGICEESREVRTGARARVVASKVCSHLVIDLKGSLSTFMQKEIALECAKTQQQTHRSQPCIYVS